MQRDVIAISTSAILPVNLARQTKFRILILLFKMVKRCAWGTCNSDTRYPERLIGGISFIPFPKLGRTPDKARKWIRLCGRPLAQLNEEILRERRKAKHLFVCSKHFVNGMPSSTYPDPISALSRSDHVTPTRPQPKARASKFVNADAATYSSNKVIRVSLDEGNIVYESCQQKVYDKNTQTDDSIPQYEKRIVCHPSSMDEKLRYSLNRVYERVSKVRIDLETEKEKMDAHTKYGQHPDDDSNKFGVDIPIEIFDDIKGVLKVIATLYENRTSTDNGCECDTKQWDTDAKGTNNPIEKIRVSLLGIYLHLIEIKCELRKQLVGQGRVSDDTKIPSPISEIRQLGDDIATELTAIAYVFLETFQVVKREGTKKPRELTDSGYVQSSEIISTPVEETRKDEKQMDTSEVQSKDSKVFSDC